MTKAGSLENDWMWENQSIYTYNNMFVGYGTDFFSEQEVFRVSHQYGQIVRNGLHPPESSWSDGNFGIIRYEIDDALHEIRPKRCETFYFVLFGHIFSHTSALNALNLFCFAPKFVSAHGLDGRFGRFDRLPVNHEKTPVPKSKSVPNLTMISLLLWTHAYISTTSHPHTTNDINSVFMILRVRTLI